MVSARAALSAGVAATAALVPRLAAACPYCAGSVERARSGYLMATALMLVMPLALLGFFAIWVARARRQTGSSIDQGENK